MSKISLIIQREYTTRVMKPAFIILTFLTPLLIAAMVMVPLWLSTFKDDSVQKIAVLDQTGMYKDALKSNELYTFSFVSETLDEVRNNDDFSTFVVISGDLTQSKGLVTVYGEEQVDLELKSYIKDGLSSFVEDQKIAALNIPDFKKLIEDTRVDLSVKTVVWGENGEEKMGSSELALAIGMITAFVIYLFIVVYGAQVMQGVVQEKTNRIVEVIISSVKPFELMMGKIIGIALVGLTQFMLWILLSVVFITVITKVTGADMQTIQAQQAGMQMSADVSPVQMQSDLQEVLLMINNFDFVQIGLMFVVYFLGGYLLYASLFAAVGSAVDNETDTQQFSLPLTLPIVFAIYAAIYSAENPDGPLALWCSMIPFTSPIVMMVRLPFGVPAWQLALSIGILILSFIASTWVAGKIYRTGILMYGKKVTWKEMMKWLTYK